jgi:hypothetical protein
MIGLKIAAVFGLPAVLRRALVADDELLLNT